MACRGARDWSRFHGTQCAKDKPAVPSWEARILDLLDRNSSSPFNFCQFEEVVSGSEIGGDN